MRLDRVLFALAIAAVVSAGTFLFFVLRDLGGSAASLTWTQLANATYPSELTRSKQATLHDGTFEEQIAPGSASKVQVRLAEIGGFGKIAGDQIDAAVVLVSSGGGSGTFVHLVAVLNQGGAPHPVAVVLLGDRVAVRGVEVKNREVVVRLRTRGATDPLTSLTHEVTRTYSLIGSQLVLKNEIAVDVPASLPSKFVYQPQSVSLVPGGGSFSTANVLPPGHSASFIVHAAVGERLKATVTSEFNNAVLSIQGLGDLTQLVTRTEFATTFDQPVPVTEDYVVRVISLAGSDLRFSLSMAAGAPPPATGVARTPTAAAEVTPAPGHPTATPSLPSRLLTGPFLPAPQPLSASAPEAVQFAETRSQTWGAAMAEPRDNLIYSVNGDAQLELASVVKVLIMTAVLGQAEQEGRYVDDAELSLLWPMITESDNDAATSLWNRIGGGPGLSSYLQFAGFKGIVPFNGDFWGTSTASPNALASVLSRMFFGDLLRDEHRALALTLMTSVASEQRWGVSAAGAPGDTVALKDGWFETDGGWRVNSVGVVLPGNAAKQPYVLAILANLQPTFSYGVETVEGIAQRVGSGVSENPVANGR